MIPWWWLLIEAAVFVVFFAIVLALGWAMEYGEKKEQARRLNAITSGGGDIRRMKSL